MVDRRLVDSLGYDVAKAGVIRMTTGLATLAEQTGIRANCLAPGWIATGGTQQYWASLTPAERAARGVPAKRLGPDEVPDVVYRLASDTSLSGRVVVWWSNDAPQFDQMGRSRLSHPRRLPIDSET